MNSDQAPKLPALGRGIFVMCCLLAVASVATVLIGAPGGTPTSSDPGSPIIPYWVTWLPNLVGVALVFLIPQRPLSMPVAIRRHDRLKTTTLGLVGLAIAFPLAVAFVPLQGELYILGKFVLLMVVPAILVLRFSGAVRIEWKRDRARWWAAGIVVVVWTLISQVAPWNLAYDLGDLDPALVITAALATALTAGVGEEMFYRRWLQTRLEATLGALPGIALASLLFALMHLGSHSTGNLPLDIARAIAIQGSFGLFVGVMWWRYRNLLAVIVAHIISNGWQVAVALIYH